jgi:hypothetical protein
MGVGVQLAFRNKIKTQVFYRIEKALLKNNAVLEPVIGISLNYKLKKSKSSITTPVIN